MKKRFANSTNPDIRSSALMNFNYDDENSPTFQALLMLKDIFKPFFEQTINLEADSSNYGHIILSLDKLRDEITNSKIFDALQNQILIIIENVKKEFIQANLANFCLFVNDVTKYIHNKDVIEGCTSFINDISESLEDMTICLEWDEFIKNPLIKEGLTPIEYWHSPEIGSILSHVALSIIHLPASTASVERSFSLQKYIHSTYRNRLSPKHVREEMIIAYNKDICDSDDTEDIVHEEIIDIESCDDDIIDVDTSSDDDDEHNF